MKWVEVAGTHFNTNQIQTFYWKDGSLRIWCSGRDAPVRFKDPDRALYLKLCRQQGVCPYEEETNG